MRLSKLFFKTFKDAPQDADIRSHQLLERAGYIRRLARGHYAYAPLMWRVLQKTMHIIREELDKADSQEVLLPQVHPKELWELSDRWDEYTITKLLYTVQDREGHEYCLAPTHEEAFTYILQNWVTSYKQLPINLYQIATKFRDEIRPRFGLMRSKEFIMKDAYAFCSSEDEMDEEYGKMRKAYERIFKRLELDFVIVQADPGKIGQGKSEEFQVTAGVGEDAILVCQAHAFNVEKAPVTISAFPYDQQLKPMEELVTPNIKTIEALQKFTQQPLEIMLKTLIYKLIYKDREEWVAIGIRSDRQINEAKLMGKFAPLDLILATNEEVKKLTQVEVGFIGPVHSPIKFFADNSCQAMTNFIVGANQKDKHLVNVNWERDCSMPEFYDFILAEEGDQCPLSKEGVYEIKRGIEVGHIFNLGTKYSDALKAFFQDKNGKAKPFWMGSYGIGVGRVIQACVEQKYDDKGIVWPLAIAPYHILVTAANPKNEELVAVTEKVYKRLIELGIEAIYDDRKERLGLKLKDSDLMGIPFKLIIGKTYEETKKLEIEPRVGEKQLISEGDLESWALDNILQLIEI